MINLKMKLAVLWGIVILMVGGVSVYSAESEKHSVILDSVEASAGEHFVVGINVIADRIADDEKPGRMGFGSFCIPLKYDKTVFVADSVIFKNTLTEWDEKFANQKFDTGFVSLAGIYDMGGEDNPPVYTPDKQERIAEIHFTAGKKSEKGIYLIELTRDPRQDTIFLGSPTGVVSVRPKFKPGIVVIK
jgi:hypothetical protein